MASNKDTVGGWIWWLTNVRTDVKRELTDQEVKDLLKSYMSGSEWNTAAKELK